MEWLSKIKRQKETAVATAVEKSESRLQKRQAVTELAQPLEDMVTQTIQEFCEVILEQEDCQISSFQGISENCWQWVTPIMIWGDGPANSAFGTHWWRLRTSLTAKGDSPYHFAVTLEITDGMPTNIYRIKAIRSESDDLTLASLQKVFKKVGRQYIALVY